MANGHRKYANDANIRFFNRNRFMPIPDTLLSQPWCPCHAPWHILNSYDGIVGYATESEPELVDTTILEEKELAPGIMEYSISTKSAHTLKGLVQNSLIQQWNEAQIFAYKSEDSLNKNIRNCFGYTVKGKESTCHPQDPIRISTESINICIDSAVEKFRERYKLAEVISESTNLLRYEEGGHFVEHVDHSEHFPRFISASMFLNDKFDGGELEFKEFELKIKPEAGKIIVFYSSKPYTHKVSVVECGIRYSAVKWYRLAKNQQ